MISKVSFLPSATQDMRQVHDWYEKQKPDLGKEFLNAVLSQIEELKKNFVIHRFFFDNVQYLQIKQFPHTIFYITEEANDQIIIVAVLGNKQDQLSIIQER